LARSRLVTRGRHWRWSCCGIPAHTSQGVRAADHSALRSGGEQTATASAAAVWSRIGPRGDPAIGSFRRDVRGQENLEEDRPCTVGNTTSRRTDSREGKSLKSGVWRCGSEAEKPGGSNWFDGLGRGLGRGARTHPTAGGTQLRKEYGLTRGGASKRLNPKGARGMKQGLGAG
jgi:hypothetical protein